MYSSGKYAAALLALAVVCSATATNAQQQVQRALYNNDEASLQDTFDEVLACYQCGCNDSGCGCESGCCCESSCGCCDYGCGYEGGYGCGGGFGGGCGCYQCFAGVEYLYVRANFSEAVAYVIQDRSDIFNNVYTVQELEFDYNSSYRFYGGIRDCCCGMEIRFDYTRFDSDAPGINIASQTGVTGIDLAFPLEPVVGPNNNITVSGDVELDSYDLSCGKTIPLGSPLCCDCGCGDCCDGCGDCCGCWCPAWDLTWEAGIRAADVSWQQNVVSNLNQGVTVGSVSSAFNRMDFEGVGLRFGLGGRRYFGRQGLFSAYLNGDISVLVGDVELVSASSVTSGVGTTAPVTVNVLQQATFRNIIPVTEIEAGLTAHLGRYVQFSSGYFLSAWHDLGFR
ncbi:MAG: Lpg1974 family pore-forming outer membrane protein, partial [Gammaproteobacteria bacterium]|nr:Lpg1974 family pore-forming outer membrane protein [Gammaproteobacteria bacterium]